MRFHRDEANRPDTTIETLAKLKPAFRKDGSITAGNAPGLNSGAAALIEVRSLIHVLHAASDCHLGVPGYFQRSAGDGLRSRPADPVDGHSGHLHREATANGGLACRVHLAPA